MSERGIRCRHLAFVGLQQRSARPLFGARGCWGLGYATLSRRGFLVAQRCGTIKGGAGGWAGSYRARSCWAS